MIVLNGIFWALPSILNEDGVKRPTKGLSRLMEGMASKSHCDFYCYGCFHSFCAEPTLKKHVELCKYNDFCKIKLPEEDKNIKQYGPGAKSLKMNSVIYADLSKMCQNKLIIDAMQQLVHFVKKYVILHKIY